MTNPFYLKASIQKPLRLVLAGRFTADHPWTHGRRTIDNIELIVGIQGTAYLQQDGERYEVGEGDVLVLLPGHPHEGYAPSQPGTSFYWVHFTCDDGFTVEDPDRAEGEMSLAGNNPYFDGLSECLLLPAFFHATGADRIGILWRQLIHINESRYYTGLGAQYALTSLVIELSQQAVARFDYSSHPPRETMSRILEWIRAHGSHAISLKDVAQEFNYSREYLARHFRKHMGMSMQDYINNLKLAKAREMLCQSDRPVREIAAALGFHDDKYFLRLFKRYERITPTEYRQAYHRIHRNNN